MVGDNNRHAQFVGVFDFFDIGNTAIDGDDEGDALIMQFIDGGYAQSVTFGNAVRNIGDDHSAQSSQSLYHQGGTGDAVYIEIAVNGDFFAGKQSPVNTGNCLSAYPAAKRDRRTDGRHRSEKVPSEDGSVKPTIIEKLGHQGRIARSLS